MCAGLSPVGRFYHLTFLNFVFIFKHTFITLSIFFSVLALRFVFLSAEMCLSALLFFKIYSFNASWDVLCVLFFVQIDQINKISTTIFLFFN